MNEESRRRIASELKRVEEDCTYSSKSHFNAADRLRRTHNWVGGFAVVLSAAGGTAILAESVPAIAGTTSLIVAVLAALLTFMKFSERSVEHKSAGDQFLALKSDVRRYREVRLVELEDVSVAMTATDEFAERQQALNRSAPITDEGDFKKARRGIEEGEAVHVVDVKGDEK